MYDFHQLTELRNRVDAGEPDPTPFGLCGDWCPFCGQDWKQPHDETCESPHNTVTRWDSLLSREVQVNPGTASMDTARYLESAPVLMGFDTYSASPYYYRLDGIEPEVPS